MIDINKIIKANDLEEEDVTTPYVHPSIKKVVGERYYIAKQAEGIPYVDFHLDNLQIIIVNRRHIVNSLNCISIPDTFTHFYHNFTTDNPEYDDTITEEFYPLLTGISKKVFDFILNYEPYPLLSEILEYFLSLVGDKDLVIEYVPINRGFEYYNHCTQKYEGEYILNIHLVESENGIR